MLIVRIERSWTGISVSWRACAQRLGPIKADVHCVANLEKIDLIIVWENGNTNITIYVLYLLIKISRYRKISTYSQPCVKLMCGIFMGADFRPTDERANSVVIVPLNHFTSQLLAYDFHNLNTRFLHLWNRHWELREKKILTY